MKKISWLAYEVALVYLIVAGLWVSFSDRLLGAAISDHHKLIRLNILVDLLTVIITAGLLLWYLRRSLQRLESEMKERQQVEASLRESEEQLRNLFNHASVGILLLSEAGQIVDVNEAFARAHGYRREEVLRMKMEDIDTPDTYRQFAERVRCQLAGETQIFEVEHRCKDGHLIQFEVSSGLSILGGKKVIQSFHRDISERKQAQTALAQNEKKFRQLVQHMPVGLVEHGPNTRVIYGNSMAAQLLGLLPEQLQGKAATNPDWKFIHEDGRPMPLEDYPVNRALQAADGLVTGLILGICRPDLKHPVWVQCNAHVNQQPDGQIKGVVVTFVDLTERKRTEAELLESKHFLRSTIDALSQHIAILDEQGTIIEVNAAWKRFARKNGFMGSGCGVGLNYLQACNSGAGEFSKEGSAAADGIRAVMAGEREIFTLEYPCHNPPAEQWFAMKITRFSGEGPLRVVVSHTEITERKRSEASNLRLATAVEQAAETVVITDTTGTILYANPAFEKSSGYSRAEALGQNPRILNSGKQDSGFYSQMWAVLQRGEIWRGHFSNKRKDGKLYEEDATISPVRDATGKVVNYVAVKRDTTHEIELESQIRQAQKMEAIGQLAGGVAHDLNNILAVIQLQVGLLKTDDRLKGLQLEHAQDIEEASDRAAALTRQLLLFSRRQAMEKRDLNLNDLVVNIAKMLKRVIGEHIQIHISLAQQPLPIHADAGMIDQVLMNLTTNARDAMPHDGQLFIETSAVHLNEDQAAQLPSARPGTFACLTVRDTGCGMSPELLQRIFEPFFTTKDIGKGTGMGLATVFGIIERHHGWINVTSELGQGTTFRVFLPALNDFNEVGEIGEAKPTIKGGQETILLVEDDPAVRLSTFKSLNRLGYRVLQATNGVDALAIWKVRQSEIKLVLTDVLMPGGVNGRDLAEKLLSDQPDLKIIYMSGYTADLVGGGFALTAGVNFLTKPFLFHQLAHIIRENLDRK